MTDSKSRFEAFRKIMGDVNMPSDTTAEYDLWLFNSTWQASEAQSAARIANLEVDNKRFAQERRDLAMLVTRLAKRLSPESNTLRESAIDYLVRKNLIGSPLREALTNHTGE